MEEKQTELETDNAGITQSQEGDIEYRRMQKLNSLCNSK